MEPILECIDKKRSVSFVIVLSFLLVVGLNAARAEDGARDEWQPPDQDEVKYFLRDAAFAERQCDVDWWRDHTLSIWTATYYLEDELTVEVGHDRYLKWLEKSCTSNFMTPGFNETGLKIKMEKDWTTTIQKSSYGAFMLAISVRNFLDIKPKKIKSIERKDSMVRTSDYEIKLLRSEIRVEKY